MVGETRGLSGTPAIFQEQPGAEFIGVLAGRFLGLKQSQCRAGVSVCLMRGPVGLF